MASILRNFQRAVAQHPDRVAIVDGQGQSTTYAQLQSRVDALAALWHQKGVRAGDRVLLAMPVNADLYASLAALWTLGATVVLPEPAMGVRGLRHAAKTTNVTAFCSQRAFGILKYALPALWRLRHLGVKPSARIRAKAVDLPLPHDDDIALISFTSGTTGAPKAIPRSHRFLSAQQQAISPVLASQSPERDLVAFPVFVLINIASGRTSVLPNWKPSQTAKLPPKDLADWIAQQQITRALLPPSLCEVLAGAPIPDSLHRVFTGGGPVFPDMIEALRRAKGNLDVIGVYGSTEAEPIAHFDAKTLTLGDLNQMVSGYGLLVGWPVDDIQIRIENDEIQVAGAHVNTGYLNPQHDQENKIKEGQIIWHRTGDAGYFDAQGRLWLLGRWGTDVMTERGVRYPFSIEITARQWPGVTRSALINTSAGACLVIEGDRGCHPVWQEKAQQMGITHVRHIAAMPMDKRHHSKIDRTALH